MTDYCQYKVDDSFKESDVTVNEILSDSFEGQSNESEILQETIYAVNTW